VHADDGPAEFKVPPALAALVAVLARLEQNPLSPRVGRILWQKLAYFATEAGLPTGFRFEPRQLGPFSSDVKAAEKRLVNNSLLAPEAVGQMIEMRVGPAYAKAEGNFASDLHDWTPVMDRLVDLFSRMSTRDAEIAATVHFAAKQLNAASSVVSEREVFDYVDEWKPTKFTADDVAITIRNLGLLGWLELKPSPTLPVPEHAI
jgi:uncharacterized protein YwgA